MRRHLCLAAFLLNTRKIALDSLEISIQLGEIAIILLINFFDDTLKIFPTSQFGRRMPTHMIP